MINKRGIAILTVFISALIFLYVLISFANKSYPMVGHDFSYFVPRLLDSYLHYKINGLSIQWYTPSFGGGIPAYPNPQHMQFTLPEALMLILAPWPAIWVAGAIYILAGFLSSYFLFEKVFEFHPFASVLGSIVFNINGFIFSQSVVGHMGYQAFPLLPLAMLVLFHPRLQIFYKCTLIALVFSLHIHGGGFYVIIIYLLSMLMAIPILLIYRPKILAWQDLAKISLGTALLFILLNGSKVHAVFSFMQWFPRELADQYDAGFFRGLYRIYLQLFGLTTRITFEKLMGTVNLTRNINLALLSRSEDYHLWEFDAGMSPVVLIMGAALLGFSVFASERKKIEARTIFLVAMALFGLWLTTEFRLTDGLIYPHLRLLPGLKSLHVNLRFTAAYLFPLSIITVAGFHQVLVRLKSEKLVTLIFSLLVAATILPLGTYYSIPVGVYQFGFDISSADIVYRDIKSGETFSIDTIRSDVRDPDTFQKHTSSFRPFEPIFGYSLEYFTPTTHPGPISETRDNYFNFTNPASLVFPEENNLYLFEKIKAGERDTLEQFINREQPAWKRPTIQYVLDIIMWCSLILIPTYVFINLWISLVHRKALKYTRKCSAFKLFIRYFSTNLFMN